MDDGWGLGLLFDKTVSGELFSSDRTQYWVKSDDISDRTKLDIFCPSRPWPLQVLFQLVSNPLHSTPLIYTNLHYTTILLYFNVYSAIE